MGFVGQLPPDELCGKLETLGNGDTVAGDKDQSIVRIDARWRDALWKR